LIPGIWNCRCGNCSGEYYPEGELILKRKEYRLEFENPWTEPVWSDFIRETKIPGAWIVVTAVSKNTPGPQLCFRCTRSYVWCLSAWVKIASGRGRLHKPQVPFQASHRYISLYMCVHISLYLTLVHELNTRTHTALVLAHTQSLSLPLPLPLPLLFPLFRANVRVLRCRQGRWGPLWTASSESCTHSSTLRAA